MYAHPHPKTKHAPFFPKKRIKKEIYNFKKEKEMGFGVTAQKERKGEGRRGEEGFSIIPLPPGARA